jgi:SAM-dependent methyltransferase
MADDVRRRTAKGAVGTQSEERWQSAGRKQFHFLRDHGLKRSDFLLEIGCGNLRAGRRFISYLPAGHYTGVDISPEILLAAQDTMVEYELQEKNPRLFLVSGTSLDFLAAHSFDVAHAHSVFTHTPLEVVTAYFAAVHRVLRPGGFFDFTYHHSDKGSWHILEEDYYYPTELLLEKARMAGFNGRRLIEWTYSQEKIRLTKPK